MEMSGEDLYLLLSIVENEQKSSNLLKQIKKKITEGFVFSDDMVMRGEKQRATQFLKELVESIVLDNEQQLVSYISFLRAFSKHFGWEQMRSYALYLCQFLTTDSLPLQRSLHEFFQEGMITDKTLANSICENYFMNQSLEIGNDIDVLENVILSYSEKFPLEYFNMLNKYFNKNQSAGKAINLLVRSLSSQRPTLSTITNSPLFSTLFTIIYTSFPLYSGKDQIERSNDDQTEASENESKLIVIKLVIISLSLLLPILVANFISDISLLTPFFRVILHILSSENDSTQHLSYGKLIDNKGQLISSFERFVYIVYGMFPLQFLEFVKKHRSSTYFISRLTNIMKGLKLNLHLLLLTKEEEISVERWKNNSPPTIITSCLLDLVPTSLSSSVNTRPPRKNESGDTQNNNNDDRNDWDNSINNIFLFRNETTDVNVIKNDNSSNINQATKLIHGDDNRINNDSSSDVNSSVYKNDQSVYNYPDARNDSNLKDRYATKLENENLLLRHEILFEQFLSNLHRQSRITKQTDDSLRSLSFHALKSERNMLKEMNKKLTDTVASLHHSYQFKISLLTTNLKEMNQRLEQTVNDINIFTSQNAEHEIKTQKLLQKLHFIHSKYKTLKLRNHSLKENVEVLRHHILSLPAASSLPLNLLQSHHQHDRSNDMISTFSFGISLSSSLDQLNVEGELGIIDNSSCADNHHINATSTPIATTAESQNQTTAEGKASLSPLSKLNDDQSSKEVSLSEHNSIDLSLLPVFCEKIYQQNVKFKKRIVELSKILRSRDHQISVLQNHLDGYHSQTQIITNQLKECKLFTRDLQEKYTSIQKSLETATNFINQQKEIFSFKLNAIESKAQNLRNINFVLEKRCIELRSEIEKLKK